MGRHLQVVIRRLHMVCCNLACKISFEAYLTNIRHQETALFLLPWNPLNEPVK